VVLKALMSRVGNGPFPTQLSTELAAQFQGDPAAPKIDDERGASTGRTRNVGYPDMVVTRTACQLNGATHLSLTKFDKLSLLPELKMATAWLIGGQRYTTVPPIPALMEDPGLQVEYVECKPWPHDLSQVRHWDDLPQVARDFVQTFERLLNEGSSRPVQIDRLGVGPGLDDVIIRC
jgi:adenylosuccinate synthase